MPSGTANNYDAVSRPGNAGGLVNNADAYAGSCRLHAPRWTERERRGDEEEDGSFTHVL